MEKLLCMYIIENELWVPIRAITQSFRLFNLSLVITEYDNDIKYWPIIS